MLARAKYARAEKAYEAHALSHLGDQGANSALEFQPRIEGRGGKEANLPHVAEDPPSNTITIPKTNKTSYYQEDLINTLH